MLKFIKSFFGGYKAPEQSAPYKVETPAAEAVQQPAEANPVAVAVALDLETADMGKAPAKKPRAPRAPKAEKAPKAPKAKAEKAPAKKAAAKKPAAMKAPKTPKSKKA